MEDRIRRAVASAEPNAPAPRASMWTKVVLPVLILAIILVVVLMGRRRTP